MSTIKIYGCSDKISELNLPKIILEDSLGLNIFPLYYKTKFWLWIDNPKFGNCVYILENNRYIPYFKFNLNFNKEKDLFGAFTVASFALHFVAKEGYKEAILYGILDGNYIDIGNNEYQYSHFYDMSIHTFHKDNLKAWNNEILYGQAHSNKINIVIPHYSLEKLI